MGRVCVRTLHDLLDEHAAWSHQTFGGPEEKGPIGPLRHLKLEADEAIAAPGDISEYVDLVFLSFDAARRAGFTTYDIVRAGFEKLDVLRSRSYPRGTGDQPALHIK